MLRKEKEERYQAALIALYNSLTSSVAKPSLIRIYVLPLYSAVNLLAPLSNSIDVLCRYIIIQFNELLGEFKGTVDIMQISFSDDILRSIQEDYDTLSKQVDDKTHQIEKYKHTISILKESTL